METTFWTPSVGAPVSATTLNIPDTVIPQGQAVQYLFVSKGNCTLGDISRIRVLANGQTIWDVSLAMYVAMLERFSANHAVINTGNKIIPLPFYLLDQKGAAARYSQQVPPGARMSVQFDIGSISASGEGLDMLTTFTTVNPLSYPTLISSPTNVAASSTNAIVQIKQNVIARGFALEDPTDITRIELNCSGLMVYNGSSGTAFQNEQLMHQCPDRATIDLDPVMNRIGPVSVGGDGTQLLLTTAAGYTGVAAEYCIYGSVPVGKQE